ncbi:hypothetical protein [Pelagimonas varians]|uniref:Lipoprotein n=1 Tax=Pelagimonas varians TaxID=696760 RepID=A0A238K0Z5_9RHOB|nr:hypothetical protein [Pelagimonas varians]PYG33134.1 hypothetical protein C8N36_102129 [Pelagimonas varians]SMX35782.1 hypothetical protein PEV8663_00591 [Pelagimonas varians]
MRRLICLMILTLFAPGCATFLGEHPRSEGKAAAILDAAQAPAKAHAAALADGSIEDARATGFVLISILSCNWRDCSSGGQK